MRNGGFKVKFSPKRSVTTTRALISAIISTQLVVGQVYAQTEVLVLKVAALQVGRRVVPQVVRLVELQVVQLVERQVEQPAEAPQVVLLAVQPVPVRQALERVLLERRVPQEPWLVRSPGLSALSAWSVRWQ